MSDVIELKQRLRKLERDIKCATSSLLEAFYEENCLSPDDVTIYGGKYMRLGREPEFIITKVECGITL